MPGKARQKLVDPGKVGVYHCYARCVRRAFLCGDDPCTGKNYDHRKEWLRKKVIELAAIFAVEVGWYAVMDNHLHLVLRIRPDLARRWSDRQVIQRACREAFSAPPGARRRSAAT